MAWKRIYWLYVGLGIVLLVGIILALVFGLSTNTNNNKNTDKLDNKENHMNNMESMDSTNNVDNNTNTTDNLDYTDSTDSTDNIETIIIPTISTLLFSKPTKLTKWTLSQKITTFEHFESFGASLSLFKDVVLVGAPSDNIYGQVITYKICETCADNISDTSTTCLQSLQNISFSYVGSAHQKAGMSIHKNMVAAPEFSFKLDTSNPPEGTLFLLHDIENENYQNKRLATYLNDDFHMVKYGQIFYYNHPYVFLTKSKITTDGNKQCVDIFELNSRLELQYLTRLSSPCKLSETLFGHHIVTSQDNTILMVSDSFTNHIYVYKTFQLWQTIDMKDEFRDDFEQSIALTSDGSKLVVGSPENNKVVMYEIVSATQQYTKSHILCVESDITDFGKKLYFSPNNTSLGITGIKNMTEHLFLFQWSDINSKFDFHTALPISDGPFEFAWQSDQSFVACTQNPNQLLLWENQSVIS